MVYIHIYQLLHLGCSFGIHGLPKWLCGKESAYQYRRCG